MGKHIKRTIKKKHIKRKQPVKKVIKTNNNQTNNTTDQTTLRNMLLMRSGLLTPGFSPQQYGNVNDKISTLQVTESTMREQNMRQKQQIDELNKSITEMKKEKHDVDTKHYRAENEYDKLRIQLDEAERVKGKTDEIQLNIRNLQKRMEEVKDDLDIKKLIEQRDRIQNSLDKVKF